MNVLYIKQSSVYLELFSELRIINNAYRVVRCFVLFNNGGLLSVIFVKSKETEILSTRELSGPKHFDDTGHLITEEVKGFFDHMCINFRIYRIKEK